MIFRLNISVIERERDRQTDGETDGETERQTERPGVLEYGSQLLRIISGLKTNFQIIS